MAGADVTLQQILALEDDPALLEFKCVQTGIPVWPGIRNQFFRFIISDLLFSTSLVELRRGKRFRRNVLVGGSAIAKSVLHNLVRGSTLHGDILLTTVGTGLFARNGAWFNRLSDHFALAARDRTVVLEDLSSWQWRFPRFNDRVLFHTPLVLYGYVAGRIAVRSHHVKKARDLIALVQARAQHFLDWTLTAQRREFLVQLLARHEAGTPRLFRAYERLLSRLMPRMLIKEMGCYGHSSVFNVAARRLGIMVTEYQHGMVSAGHDAYNVAPSLAASNDYRSTIPEFFLSYGDWWSEQINMPLAHVPIGNPHRTEQIARLGDCSGDKNDILILGDSFNSTMYLGLAERLIGVSGRDQRVVFRPHHLERERIETQFPAGRCGSVYIDRRPDIYDSFRSAKVVISEASTGLFEAVGLVEKIFVFATPRARFALPRHPFAEFESPEELISKLADDEVGRPRLGEVSRVWMPGWRDNYLEFLEAQLEN